MLDWMYDHPEEAMKDPLAQRILNCIHGKVDIAWRELDPFTRASFFKQLINEIPQFINQARLLPSPFKEDELTKWKTFIEIVISREYESEPEKISLTKYRPAFIKFIDELREELNEYEKTLVSFRNLLTIGSPSKFLLHLHKLYKNRKPQEYVIMLYALHDLGLLKIHPLKYDNRTELHTIIENEFGKVGTRQQFNINVSQFNSPRQLQNIKIDHHKKEIKELYELTHKEIIKK